MSMEELYHIGMLEKDMDYSWGLDGTKLQQVPW